MSGSLFRAAGAGYVMAIAAAGVELHAQRLRWQNDDLKGELAIMCGIVGGRAIDGCLSRGTFNFSSPVARVGHAKYLGQRSRTSAKDFPFLDWLDEFCEHVIRATREGTPSVLLRDVPMPAADNEYSVDGFRFPMNDATILFGDAEGGKSSLALYVAGRLSQQGIATGFYDFEWSPEPHRGRLALLFPGNEPPIHYMRCDRALVHEADRIQADILKHRIRYGIFDSVGYGCTGRPEDAESALAYMRTVRPLNIGSMHLAHITKPGKADTPAEREVSTQRPFGSAFWHTSARSTWFVKRTNPDASSDAPLVVGLYNRKRNDGPRHPAIGFQFLHGPDRIEVSRVDLAEVDDLGASMPTWQRMRSVLKTGALPVPSIAAQLDVPEATVRQVLKRDRDRAPRKAAMFVAIDGGLVGLSDRRSA